MKKINLILSCFVVCGVLAACNGSSDSNTSTSTTSTTSDSSSANKMNDTNSSTSANANTNTNTNTTVSKTPLGAQDSMFMMKAAAGGMMEVSGGNTAQANAASDRVKSFGGMMVTDHTKANNELMALASGKGVTLPSALPADEQKHLDAMSKMKGKEFDSHYMNMMLTDHKKDIADFEKEASSGKDPDLKAWASKTLPTLKAHLDSAQAISKAHM